MKKFILNLLKVALLFAICVDTIAIIVVMIVGGAHLLTILLRLVLVAFVVALLSGGMFEDESSR